MKKTVFALSMLIACGALGADAVKTPVGATVLFCANGAYAWQAIGALNDVLVKNPNPLVFNSWDSASTMIQVDQPYSVSSPTIGTYQREGTSDVACVAVTKH
jgi:hypothetical protein